MVSSTSLGDGGAFGCREFPTERPVARYLHYSRGQGHGRDPRNLLRCDLPHMARFADGPGHSFVLDRGGGEGGDVSPTHITEMRPGGFEPPTNSLEGCCSIHLSYGRAIALQQLAALRCVALPNSATNSAKTYCFPAPTRRAASCSFKTFLCCSTRYSTTFARCRTVPRCP